MVLRKLNTVRTLLRRLPSRRGAQIFILLVALTAGSFAEALSIGAIFPLIALLVSPDFTLILDTSREFLPLLQNYTDIELIYIYAAVFSLLIFLTTCLRSLVTWLQIDFSHRIGNDLSMLLFDSEMKRDYLQFKLAHSSEALSAITQKVNAVIYGIFIPILTIVTGAIYSLSILSALLIVNPLAILSLILIFGLLYAGLLRFFRKRIAWSGKEINSQIMLVTKLLQEVFLNIREIKFANLQSYFHREVRTADRRLRQAQATSQTIAALPRFVVEGVAIIALSWFSVILIFEIKLENPIPLLGMIAVGAQRLMPNLQHIYASISSVRTHWPIFETVVDATSTQTQDTELQNQAYKPLAWQKSISFQSMGFTYPTQTKPALTDITFTLKKGETVAIIGKSGCGKTTLIDVFLGLLEPQQGEILIDGVPIQLMSNKRWQQGIAFLDQHVTVFDNSIKNNITLFKPISDKSRDLKKAVRLAEIDREIQQVTGGFDTFLGEHGANFSGGQLQRIGLARLFYNLRDIVILDEPTNFIDAATEEKIIENLKIEFKERTVIIVTHREALIALCDRVFEMKEGKIINIKDA